ncbi:MAG: hypothetical protein ACXAE3_13255 [Candidatus Kariarchaeaceae archaeon]|jgi:hypothetical protein
MTQRRFSLLPADLRKIIILTAGMTFIFALSSIITFPFGIVAMTMTVLYGSITWGLYHLKPWARTFAIWGLSIAAFFAGIRIIQFFILIIPGIIFAISIGMYGGLFPVIVDGLIGPLFTFYLLYLVSNEGVKQYFDYPEMVTDRTHVKKEEPRAYRSFSSID